MDTNIDSPPVAKSTVVAAQLSSRERFPELFCPASSHTNPHERTRKVPMRVLCLGLPRTGTASMWAVLKKLGFVDCYHMLSVLKNPPDADMWLEAINAKYNGKGRLFEREDWDRLLGECQSVCDAPCAFFAEELIAAYPEAKVILSLRDVDSWYNSCMSTVVKVQESKILDILQHFDPALLGHWNPMRKALWASFWGGDFESHAKGKFVEHYDMVRRLVPEERLLEYRVGEGWERLCGFLETPVPEEEFPVTNERNTFGDRIQVMVVMAVGRAAKRVLPVLGGIVAVGVAAWMYGR